MIEHQQQQKYIIDAEYCDDAGGDERRGKNCHILRFIKKNDGIQKLYMYNNYK